MTTLSEYMSEARNRGLPDAVVERAKQDTIDTVAAMVRGLEVSTAMTARRTVRGGTA